MHALIVHCHPEPTSFNATLTGVAATALRTQGHTVEVSDLYAEGFDPVEAPRHFKNREDESRFAPLGEQRHAWNTDTLPADVRREIDRLERADLVILQFPLWWHAQPAMLKGWFDRVFVSGGLYTSRMRYDAGYFRGKRAICSLTTGAPEVAMQGRGRGGDIDALLWPIQYSMYYMGFDVLPPYVAYGVQGHGFGHQDESAFLRELEARKAAWANRLETLDDTSPLSFPGWDDWDELGQYKGAA
jgi:NAD(P)H dehydrogenase (quinone)